MAFRFNQIDQQMTPQQSNIFDPGGNGQNPEIATQQMTGSSSSGGGGASSGGGGMGSAPAAQQQKSGGGAAPTSGQVSAFKAASARAKAPDSVVRSTQGSLAAADSKLQADANSYSQKATEKATTYATPDKVQIDKAAGGDKDAMQSVGNRLSGAAPEQFEAFQGLGADTPTAANRFMNPASLYGGQGYTAGLGRFDSALLRNNRDFRGIQSQLMAEQERIKQASDQKTKELTEKARADIKEGYEKGNQGIQTYLEQLSGDTLKRAKEMEMAEDQKRAGLKAEDISKEKYAEIMRTLGEDFAGQPESIQARAIKNYGQSPMDLSRFITFDRDTDWQEFVTPEEVERFNRIQGLMGGKDLLTAPGEGGAGDPYGFNEQGAYGAIMDAIVGQQREQDRLAAEAQAREEAEARAMVQKSTDRVARSTRRAVRGMNPVGKGGKTRVVDPAYGNVPVYIGDEGIDDPYNVLT